MSLVIVAAVIVVGIRGIFSGLALGGELGGNLLDAPGRGDRDSVLSAQRTRGTMAYVLDGDTVQVTTRAGASVRVRFLGISASEIPHPGRPGECYGQPSKQNLEQLLPVGTRVTLVSDPSQRDVDTYGRWLRYVQADGRDVGAAQIHSGGARPRTSSPPVARSSAYTELEDTARGRGAGMWSACR
ncbi:thermonuclease family protein [Nocardioides sp. JQ2195]|uniref:thermonuclease family protein n=1 Tax=Nocardioides sp. JQ2195 TaxID=2592334 RepID=UPI001F118591|nr:thermonuclease family protein [Nocardioides sp. JQ2195]